MQKPLVYLDYNATTPVSEFVVSKISELVSEWGNPSSIHIASRGPKLILRETRNALAQYFQCSPLELIFNSGASEGNNTVLKSIWQTQQNLLKHNSSVVVSNDTSKKQVLRNEFLISSVEHPSVIKSIQYLESLGAVVRYIPVSRSGEIDLNFIQTHLSEKTALVSVMLANNETGVVFPLKEIATMAHQVGAFVHADCVQAFGKIDINLKDLDLDYATFSAHKFYALKGTGVLFVKKNSPYINLVHGGGQERARRGGTENILGIASLQVMSAHLNEIAEKKQHIEKLRNYFEEKVIHEISDVVINSQAAHRLPNTSSLVIRGVDGETLLVSLDLKGFAVSTGAACSSGNPEPSPVLLAIGLTRDEAQNSLRVSLGWPTTQNEIDQFLHVLKETVTRLRSLNSEM